MPLTLSVSRPPLQREPASSQSVFAPGWFEESNMRHHSEDSPSLSPRSSPSPSPPPKFGSRWKRYFRSFGFEGIRFSSTRAWMVLVFLVVLLIIERHYHNAPLGNVIETPFPIGPPENTSPRRPDTIDTFQFYRYRDSCDVSSLQLHSAFAPLCIDRASLLTAMSSGGRIGFDAPYMPRGCDMRWFTSEEVCEILGRFDRVVLVGDSMMRHVMGTINILIRKNIGYGAVTDWNFSQEERNQCFCNEQFDIKFCSVQGIYKTSDVYKNDPQSISCKDPVNVIIEQINTFPVPKEEVGRLQQSIGKRSVRPKAFVLGHGLWSNLEVSKSVAWLDTVLALITTRMTSDWKALLVTPNAAGIQKPDMFLVAQGNKASSPKPKPFDSESHLRPLMLYEERMASEAKTRGIEHLGTWNMSIQSHKFDGVHLDMRGNMVKAMMIINWLNMI
ncbi:hypothetical protein BJ878DRAFT_578663 [Calycina marina]|uniref:Uncharacterized protein n=1 Tax=Calycina marina TaxID=1763456 RepID=A0A9P7YWG1_9HELO|nr:hypothetical protein BJ878DRAFT_578663 [Calycina marina]